MEFLKLDSYQSELLIHIDEYSVSSMVEISIIDPHTKVILDKKVVKPMKGSELQKIANEMRSKIKNIDPC